MTMTGETGHDASQRRASLVAGMRLGTGLAAAAFVLAVTFGAMTQDLGWGMLAPVVCSLVVFSGSAQFALATALAGGGGIVPAVTAAGLINARFLPMGVAVAGSLRGGRLRRAVEGQAVVDASWAAAHARRRPVRPGTTDRSHHRAVAAWVAGTAVGVFLAPPPEVATSLGLDLVFPGFFLVLLMDEIRESSAARWAAAAGAAIAAGLVWIVPAGIALVGSTVAALAGLRHSGTEQR